MPATARRSTGVHPTHTHGPRGTGPHGGAMSLRRSKPLFIGALVVLVGGLAGGRPAAAADSRSTTVATKAIAWIATQQRDDGGFGEAEAGFAGFETPDAVLAIADAAQPSLAYSP